MQSVLVTFMSSAPLDELTTRFEAHALALAGARGLVMNTWILDDTVVGGFHVFEDRAAADAYLSSELFDALLTDSTFVHFKVQRFDVWDDLSAITRSPRGTRVTERDATQSGDTRVNHTVRATARCHGATAGCSGGAPFTVDFDLTGPD